MDIVLNLSYNCFKIVFMHAILLRKFDKPMFHSHFQTGMKNISIDWKVLVLLSFGNRGSTIKHGKFHWKSCHDHEHQFRRYIDRRSKPTPTLTYLPPCDLNQVTYIVFLSIKSLLKLLLSTNRAHILKTEHKAEIATYWDQYFSQTISN